MCPQKEKDNCPKLASICIMMKTKDEVNVVAVKGDATEQHNLSREVEVDI